MLCLAGPDDLNKLLFLVDLWLIFMEYLIFGWGGGGDPVMPWCQGRFQGQNPRGRRPQGFWPRDLPRHNIHHDTSKVFTNSALWAELVQSPTRPSGSSWSSSHKVCLFVCLLSPSHAIFLRGRTGAERASSVDWCDLDLDLDLEQSPKNKNVFRSSVLNRALKTRMCSGVRSQSRS